MRRLKVGMIVGFLLASMVMRAFGAADCASADLIHRWSFTGNYTDSVGGITAVGTGSVSWNDADNPTEIKLAGGSNGTSYINLGKNIVPSTSSPITIEIWATQHSVKNWSRIFDFGSDNKNYLLMSWSQGTDGNADRVELDKGGTVIVKGDNTMKPYALNTKYHISMTMTPTGDGKTAFAWAKRDVTTGVVLCSGSATSSADWDPSTIASFPNNYLGRSEYSGDNDANASYDEVRIWKAALTAEQLRWSAQLGPDLPPTAEAVAGINHTITLTSANGTVSVNGAAGVGTSNVTIPCASDVRLAATAAEGYTFCRWEVDEQYLTSGSLTSKEITVNLPRDIAVTAVFDASVVKYARYANGEFNYLSAGKGPVAAPAGGINSDITIVFSTDAEYQALKTIPEEVAKAKGLELEANIKLDADADWTALDYSLGGNSIDINGKHFTTGSLKGEGGITSDGSIIANGGFEANPIADGAYVVMTPNGWKNSGSVVLIKNNHSHGDSECNGSNWCMVWSGAYIYREFTVVQSGDYHFQFDVASRNSSSWWNSSVYAGFDDNNVITEYTNTWNSRTKSFTVNLGVGTHTLKIGCNAGSAILVDNVQLYKTSNSATTGILEVKVPEGQTVTNDTVLLGGGQALQLWKTGKGELVMNKANSGYGSPNGYVANVVKEGVMCKSTTAGMATCGSQYTTIQVENGATFDLKGRTYWDYDYLLNGSGVNGAGGALINTVSCADAWKSGSYGYLRHVELGSDTTIGGTQTFGMSFLNYGAVTMTMNGHAVHYAGAVKYFGSMNYAGEGRIVIDQNGSMQVYGASPTAPGCTLEVNGELQHHDAAFASLSNLIFTATGSFNSPWTGTPMYTVLDTYAPNLNTTSGSKATHPTITLGTADSLYTTLDLSHFSNAFDASSTTFFANSVVTVEFGARAVTDEQKVISWSTQPTVSSFIASGTNLNGASVEARADGLYVVNVPACAEWDVANARWKYFTGTGDPYPLAWDNGVTSKIEVRFRTLEEYNAIRAQSVTPSRFVLTQLDLSEGSALYDFTNGFDFSVQPGMVIDLKGNRLKLPCSCIGGVVPFTVTDSGAADSEGCGELIVDVPGGTTVANANVTIAGSARLVKSGTGTLTANKASQTYTGGTRITAGQIAMGNTSCFGAVGSEVRVDANATLEGNGVGDIYNYTYVLNGGTMQNTKADLGEGRAQISNMRLTADSTFKPSNSFGFIGPGYAATKLDLAGHKLTVPIGTSGKKFYLFNTTVTAGTIDITSGGWLRVDKTAVNAGDTTFRINCALNISVPFRVGDYEGVYAANYNDGTGVMTVNHGFKPGNAYFRGVTLADGATLDLSGYTGVWTAQSAFTTGSNLVNYPTGTTETPAKLWVELHGREVTQPKIVNWETAPENVIFEATPTTRNDGRHIITRSDGLYVVGGSLVIIH